MGNTALVTRWFVRVAGPVQIVLGLTFWSGHALSLLPVHMLIGLLLSLGLAVLAVLASRTGAGAGTVALGIACALLLPAFGMLHVGLLVGSWHWVVRLLHLALGVGALAFADRLAQQVLRVAPTRRSTAGAAADDDFAASGTAT